MHQSAQRLRKLAKDAVISQASTPLLHLAANRTLAQCLVEGILHNSLGGIGSGFLGKNECKLIFSARYHLYRPSGTGPVGPAMARPIFELGCTFFSLKKYKCEIFKIKSEYNNKATSFNRKIATNCDSGIQPTYFG